MPERKVGRRTLVVFLLDHTGSVENFRDQTINAFNAFLRALKAEGDRIDFMFFQFSQSGLRILENGTPVRDVPELTRERYVPRGWMKRRHSSSRPSLTVVMRRLAIPLIDAVRSSVANVGRVLRQRDDRPKVVFCMHVDGMEGRSTRHRWSKLRATINDRVAQGWQFNFLGTGARFYEQGLLMGIPASHIVHYNRPENYALIIDETGGKTRKALLAAAKNIRTFAGGRRKSTAFSKRQKAAVGDRFTRAEIKAILGNRGEAESAVRRLAGRPLY